MKVKVVVVQTVFRWNTAIFTFVDENGNKYTWETQSNKAFVELSDAILHDKEVEIKSFKFVEDSKSSIKNVRYSVVNA